MTAPTPTPTPASTGLSALWPKIARSALLLAGLAGFGLAINAMPAGMDGSQLAAAVTGQGPRGQAIFVLLVIGFCAAGLPRQIAAFAAGYAFDLWPGIPLVLAGLILACATDFFWARLVARDWARRRVLSRLGGRLARLDAFLAANPFSTTLIVRLLPVGSNVGFSLLAGVSAVSALPFLAASAVGYIPQTLVFTLLGSGVGVSDWVRITLGATLFVASVLLGIILFRRNRVAAGVQ